MLKAIQGRFLHYDIPHDNKNSGGRRWRKSWPEEEQSSAIIGFSRFLRNEGEKAGRARAVPARQLGPGAAGLKGIGRLLDHDPSGQQLGLFVNKDALGRQAVPALLKIC